MNAKIKPLNTSEQVKNILHEKGLSKVFTYSDYEYFKKQCKAAFNRAQAIADLFIQYNDDTPSDYHDYVY